MIIYPIWQQELQITEMFLICESHIFRNVGNVLINTKFGFNQSGYLKKCYTQMKKNWLCIDIYMREGGELIIIYLFNLDVNKNIRNLAKKKKKIQIFLTPIKVIITEGKGQKKIRKLNSTVLACLLSSNQYGWLSSLEEAWNLPWVSSFR